MGHTPAAGWYLPPNIRWYRWGDYAWYSLARRPTPYVRQCLRRGLWFHGAALAVSLAGSAFFATALWLATHQRGLLGLDAFRATLALATQLAASVCLALEVLTARREHRVL